MYDFAGNRRIYSVTVYDELLRAQLNFLRYDDGQLLISSRVRLRGDSKKTREPNCDLRFSLVGAFAGLSK
jgi:hypothetical protein